jgi:S1-C subfamily serine protease
VKASGLPLTVITVDATSPAERAGIKRGDQLVQLNGKPLKGFIEFNRELMKLGSAQDFALGLQRGSDRRTVTVRMVSFAELIRKKLGVSVEEVNQDPARQSGMAEYRGLMVASVDRGSAAAEANLQRGMLITAIDRDPVVNLESAGRILNQKSKTEVARLTVIVPRQYRNFTRLEEASINVPVK